MGGLPLSKYVEVEKTQDEHDPLAPSCSIGLQQSLRQTCYLMLRRAAASESGRGIASWYKADELAVHAGVDGRLFSGMSDLTDAEARTLSRFDASNYNCTRAIFTYRKAVKELLRGGKESEDTVRDYDISCSFSRAFLDRHPWASSVGMWVTGELLGQLQGIPREVAKDFVNRCFGLGERGMREWCEAHGFSSVPEPLMRYHGDIQKGMDIDMERHGDKARKIQSQTGKTGWALKVAVAYVLNSMFERKTLEDAASRLRGLADVCCWELDGMFIRRLGCATWQQIEEKLCPVLKYKPYRTRSELMCLLQAETPCGPASLQPTDRDSWLASAELNQTCARRLLSEEKPIVWLATILHDARVGKVLLADKFKTSPCAGKSLSCYYCAPRPNGYIWEPTVGDHDVRLEGDLVKALCSIIGRKYSMDVPADWVGGSLTRQLSQRLAQPLYDAGFLSRMDGDCCNGKIAFKCGTVHDLRANTNPVRASEPADCIRRHLSYDYPSGIFDEIREKEAALGISMADTLAAVNAWEANPLNAGKAMYPRNITDNLERLTTSIPEFAFFKMMHDSFTPRYDAVEVPDPETHGGWQSTVFRTMKAPAAAMGQAHEHSIFYLGREGDNGKGVLHFAFSQVFDGYFEDLPLSLVSKDPPSGGNVSPEVWQLKGARLLGTPESEKTLTIKSIWCKQLADPSTVWKARGLYQDTQAFKIPALWTMSTNMGIKLTSIDGGIRRRFRGCQWPVSWKKRPVGPFQRPRSEVDLKRTDYWTPSRKAGIVYTTICAFSAFFRAGGVGLEVVPKTIANSTGELMRQEYSEFVQEWLDTKVTQVDRVQDSNTKKILAADLDAFISQQLSDNEKVNRSLRDLALDACCSTSVPWGTSERIRLISSGKYLAIRV